MSAVTLSQAVARLRQGEVVAVPTETVYGLAGRIDSEAALKTIFTVKQRPYFDPLIVHVPDVASARGLCAEWPSLFDLLCAQFWPGSLTLIAPKRREVSPLITASLDTVAIRCPRHPLALQVLRQLGVPFAAPSANRFGRTSPTTAAHVETEFAGEVAVLDGGPCSVGVESTVIQTSRLAGSRWQIQILRPGGVSRHQLRTVLAQAGVEFELCRATSNAAPGQLKAHYQPLSPLILFENQSWSPSLAAQVETHLGYGFQGWSELRLADTPQDSARLLYGRLRDLSTDAQHAIWITRSADQQGEDWEAVWDRVERAASLIFPPSKDH